MVRGSSPGSGKPRNYAKGFLRSCVRGSIRGKRKIPQYLCPRKLKLWQELYSFATECYFEQRDFRILPFPSCVIYCRISERIPKLHSKARAIQMLSHSVTVVKVRSFPRPRFRRKQEPCNSHHTLSNVVSRNDTTKNLVPRSTRHYSLYQT